MLQGPVLPLPALPPGFRPALMAQQGFPCQLSTFTTPCSHFHHTLLDAPATMLYRHDCCRSCLLRGLPRWLPAGLDGATALLLSTHFHQTSSCLNPPRPEFAP